jgi:hypothetical protein
MNWNSSEFRNPNSQIGGIQEENLGASSRSSREREKGITYLLMEQSSIGGEAEVAVAMA